MITALRNLPAPAKLNLFLHVTGRRSDGYHLLETVFELIDLQDRVHLSRRDDGRVVRVEPIPEVDPEQDLTVRAARLLAQASGCPLGVEIALDKRIPMGGGLGGGSSDAATVLLALNRLWDLHWPCERLAALGLRLGADVPFFVFGETAYATGIGEQLQPLPLPQRWYVVLAPRVGVPTQGVFADPDLTRDTKPLKIRGLSRGDQVFRGRNDLQRVVMSRQPLVAAALEALEQAARDVGIDPRPARMTGSGACVFLPLDSESAAVTVCNRLQGRTDARILTARSLPRHPLREWAFGGVAASHDVR
ncbi:MAG TPA: 4-(cytidine 5'-diphospho)-2-C-methyl-D-erythritol kinase [Quisquiliibacterium sp.]|nr:4-(cytidine 5'-diphospho)-2-C-methyl-D-erythritol kinase [Quisquiliibacterium sp.]HQN10843.1 4-(cytidine 5'-diphospho)-2-C-methyl-D-erythritol kinase [Quisquiliibacterium sp.]HQP66801.1 4-(cytidine 5'-diphospho)-2-C-methyl-D-erythritol kinase [Quisquiliibacterium sp.]